MAKKTTTKTLRILRLVLLVGLVAFVAFVVMLYRFGRAGLPRAPQVAERSTQGERGSSVMSGEGFDYTVTQGGDSIARIRAQRVVSQEEDEVRLERIDPIEVYREDGDLYRVFSDSGTYNFESQETTLEGNVRIEGPRGLTLYADGMAMGRRAQTVSSRGTVRFAMAGELIGRARSLTANLKRDIFTLSGRVEIESTSVEREPVRLRCRHLIYDRDGGVIRAAGSVRFERGNSFLAAPNMQFYLTEDESRVRYVAAREGVAALYLKRIGRAIERRLELAGAQLGAVLDPDSGEPVEAEIRGGPAGTARLWSTDEASLVRSLEAPVLHALFTDGEISYAEAFETVHLRETLAFDRERVLRWGCGERVEVSFSPDGEIREATFYERVEFRDAQGLARGDRIDMTGDPYEIRMTGAPARILGVQGELTAPEIVQQGEGGQVRAIGGVRGLFEQGGRQTLSVGGAKGPVRLESQTAFWSRQEQAFQFDGKVRLWQEENLLLTDALRTETARSLVIAEGSVRTILVPEQKGGQAAAGETAKGEAEAGAEGAGATGDEAGTGVTRDPIEVTSERMEYDTERQTILYREGVVITQIGRVMVCDEAEAQMLEGGGVRTLDCRGNARVDDSVAGRSVEGDTALYELALGEITFTGDPVVLTGEGGERIEGRTMVYDLETGGARIIGARGVSRPASEGAGAASGGAESTAGPGGSGTDSPSAGSAAADPSAASSAAGA